jgi:hypothetical protein
MVWTGSAKDGSETCFEAWFHDAEEAREFRYRVRSIAEVRDNGEVGAHKTPDETQRRALLSAIEEGARASLRAVESEYAAQPLQSLGTP